MAGDAFGFVFDNSYARALDGFYVPWQGARFPAPEIARVNVALAGELGLDPEALASPDGAALLAGSVAPEGAAPLAQAYAGHQFGGFSPQLGDGRALLLGEVIDRNGARRDIHLKGSGRTPFARGGDGKAVLGPMLREYVVGEAMHALGIPTTRALSVVTTGEAVWRETPQPGAVLARVAASHLRVGTFQFFAARGQTDRLRQLADYAIDRHYPALKDDPERYLGLLRAVAEAQADLIARWMSVGFIHGVMNTDNMTISGESIDYGPCAFMDAYDPATVFSSIDNHGRYAYGNQPTIAQWNLARFAETLVPLIDAEPQRAVDRATEVIVAVPELYRARWLAHMGRKIGLTVPQEADAGLIEALLERMAADRADFTLTFRSLGAATGGAAEEFLGLVPSGAEWMDRWRKRLAAEKAPEAGWRATLDAVNPLYIPRNHKVEEALAAAAQGRDLTAFDRLVGAVSAPFTVQPGLEDLTQPAPASDPPYCTYCGT